MDQTPRLYSDLASWWPLLSPPSDYEEEAAFYRQAVVDASATPPKTMLELGSGGGNNASYLREYFQMTLVDRSPGMLEVSRALNPGCDHVPGDMRSVRLGRQFDCVFVHDAVCYMTTLEDLGRVMETAFVHCQPGGVVLFAPDYTTDTFEPSTDAGGHDGRERALRYLEWTWDPDPTDSTYVVDFTYLLRTGDGSVHVEHDRHVEGLFPRAAWLQCLHDAGFEPRVLPFPHSQAERDLDVFIGTRATSREAGVRPRAGGAGRGAPPGAEP